MPDEPATDLPKQLASLIRSAHAGDVDEVAAILQAIAESGGGWALKWLIESKQSDRKQPPTADRSSSEQT